jgi:hypothetical protein
MSFGGDPDFTFAPQPGEWKCCYHKSIDQETGICRDCGQRAAIKLENLTAGERALLEKHLGEEKPVEKDIRFAVEEFESACDEAIARIGGGAAGTIFMQRRARFDLIRDREMMEKSSPAEKQRAYDPREIDQAGMADRQARLDATARDAKQRLEEEKAREEAERIGSIKALNKEFF